MTSPLTTANNYALRERPIHFSFVLEKRRFTDFFGQRGTTTSLPHEQRRVKEQSHGDGPNLQAHAGSLRNPPSKKLFRVLGLLRHC